MGFVMPGNGDLLLMEMCDLEPLCVSVSYAFLRSILWGMWPKCPQPLQLAPALQAIGI